LVISVATGRISNREKRSVPSTGNANAERGGSVIQYHTDVRPIE